MKPKLGKQRPNHGRPPSRPPIGTLGCLFTVLVVFTNACGGDGRLNEGQTALQASTTATQITATTTSTTVLPTTTSSLSTTTTTIPLCAAPPSRFGAPGPHVIETHDGTTYLFGENVIAADRQLAVQGVKAGLVYLDKYLGGVGRGLCIDFRVDRSRASQGEYISGSKLILLFTVDTGYGSTPEAAHPRWHLAKTAAHEYTHHWQAEFPRGLGAQLPGWLREGLAEYAGFHAVIEAGIVSDREARTYALREATLTDAKPLPEYELLDATHPMNYGLAQFAIERLISYRGDSAIRTLWSLFERMSWGDALQAVYGMTPEVFYADFASFRAKGFPS